jgi:glycosyltransferase involved in cell wall biosynthesis
MTVTEQDRQLLQKISGCGSIGYLPRGVDVPPESPPASIREKGSLLFIGTFNHQPNIDAAEWLLREIFPSLQAKHPHTILHVIGANPPSHLQRMASSLPNVRLHGFVDDVEQYLDRSTVFVAPLKFGGGVKIKILHAMSRGIPVVTTSVGAEGIDGLELRPLLIANSTASIVSKISLLLDRQDVASSVGDAGFVVARGNYSWQPVIARLEAFYSLAIEARRAKESTSTSGKPVL